MTEGMRRDDNAVVRLTGTRANYVVAHTCQVDVMIDAPTHRLLAPLHVLREASDVYKKLVPTVFEDRDLC